jgi:hypothetical protein
MTIASKDYLRKCVFRPYKKGPVFTLRTWDTHRSFGVNYSQSRLGYELKKDGAVLFSGEDFGCSCLDAIDSDKAICAIMSFLTLRPGDTDAEYFANYTDEQLAFARDFGDGLELEVARRFGA